MRISLCSVVALLELSRTFATADHPIEPDTVTSCRARAWVRAPDLESGQVVQGDVKVKLDGACEEVSSYTLKLRFAERAWVKTRREGVKLPERPAANYSSSGIRKYNGSVFEPDTFFSTRFSNHLGVDNSVWDKYEDEVKDPSLWLVREEERVGFEAKYDLCRGKHPGHDVVESFGILVPSTSYPPAVISWQIVGGATGELDDAGSEHIYAYVVDVAFMNGTILEVPAGYTSFKHTTVTTLLSETVNVSATSWSPAHVNPNDTAVAPENVDVFTLEVAFPHGIHLEQGSINNITVISHQVGPGIERPVRLSGARLSVSEKRHWAASMAVDNTTAKSLLDVGKHFTSQLVPTNPVGRYNSWFHHNTENLSISPEIPQDGVVKNGTVFSTKQITAQFRVPENSFPPFEMHYQTIAAELTIMMAVHNVSSSGSEEEEYYDWVPTIREETIREKLLSARIPIVGQVKQDAPTTKSGTVQNVHYLSPEARAPVFVDPTSAQNLLQNSSEERDVLAPKAQPTFTTRNDHDVVKDRYFVAGQWGSGLHYVGDTWLRKVVLSNQRDQAGAPVELRVQS